MSEEKKKLLIVPYPFMGHDSVVNPGTNGYYGVPYAFVEEPEEKIENR